MSPEPMKKNWAAKGNPDFPIRKTMTLLKAAYRKLPMPIVTEQTQAGRDPFKVLISTMISLRTKDNVTAEASARLYALADTPRTLADLDETRIAQAIYPAGFYKTKAKNIREAARRIAEDFGGVTPDDIDTLTGFSGVGRKTANLVLTLGYNKLGICVDTHVHRITNRWGYVRTQNPDETEMVLRAILPTAFWIPINDYLVAYGQNLCTPQSPWCSRCTLTEFCARVEVPRSR
jgi:endonuclease-3